MGLWLLISGVCLAAFAQFQNHRTRKLSPAVNRGAESKLVSYLKDVSNSTGHRKCCICECFLHLSCEVDYTAIY
jgi:hypothetical protein